MRRVGLLVAGAGARGLRARRRSRDRGRRPRGQAPPADLAAALGDVAAELDRRDLEEVHAMAADVEPRLRIDRLALEVASRTNEAPLVDEVGVGEDGRGARQRAARGQPGPGEARRRLALGRRLDGGQRAVERRTRRQQLHGRAAPGLQDGGEGAARIVTVGQRLDAEGQRQHVGEAVDDRGPDDALEHHRRAVGRGDEAHGRREQRGPATVRGHRRVRLRQPPLPHAAGGPLPAGGREIVARPEITMGLQRRAERRGAHAATSHVARRCSSASASAGAVSWKRPLERSHASSSP